MWWLGCVVSRSCIFKWTQDSEGSTAQGLRPPPELRVAVLGMHSLPLSLQGATPGCRVIDLVVALSCPKVEQICVQEDGHAICFLVARKDEPYQEMFVSSFGAVRMFGPRSQHVVQQAP